ncbi:hypothetical protein POPTR_003G041600v4 [Populus trichocarpa]|uniref:Uncharacterized protein n=1 Tax=Populus trichocarpa TaxID=3694 RepID=A0ACC0T821_POPTR|nr:hypothetical protein POPTR_003G041600v4 [Populus trichocarpa]
MGLFLQMLTVFVTTVSLQGWLPLGCLEEERIALLQLKDSLNHPNGTSLPSWIKADAHCCSWERIECSSSTGRVTELYLEETRNEELGDWYLNTSLFLPFQQLEALYLSGNRIAGWVEKKGGYELQRLRNLDYLDLGSNSLDNSILSFVEGFPSLKLLYLYYNRLEGLIDLKESLSSLEVLGLSGNNINKLIASRGPSNLTTLYLHNITTYESSFQLLQSLGSFPNLTTLHLSYNDFRGRILGDDELQNLSSLESLYLDGCSLDEHSLQSLGALPSLKNLSLFALGSTVPSGGFLDLKNLEYLDLSSNTLNNSIFQAIRMMTSLKTLILRSCKLDGQIPIAQGFLDLKNLEYLDLSYNTLNNSIFQAIRMMTSLKTLILRSCKLDGQIPIAQGFLNLKNLELLDLSSNTLDNSIFQTIGLCDLNHLQELSMYDNDLNGFLPLCLANLTSLQQLDLSSNHLKIPMSLSPLYNLSKLKYFDGSDNEIYTEEDDHSLSPKFKLESISLSSRGQGAGAFPKFLYHQFSLQSLHLTNIQIKGEFPNWLIENNTYLHDLSLENCSLSGPFLLPNNSHVNLSFLSISMNYFQGQIPSEIGARLPGLDQLTLIDLSHNHLSGNILSWMISTHHFPQQYNSYNDLSLSQQSFEFTTKNVSLSYRGSIIQYFTGIDFSCNNFIGEIPPEIGNLSMIKVLNLSHNSLTGPIPPTFSNLKEIESLDLSYNKLDGEIPPQLTELFSLEFFSVAHNNLSGKTLARVAQFATFEESCYKDNPFLCGEPLPKICGAAMPPSSTPTSTNNEDDGGFMDMEVFYVTFGVAYIMVLLVVGAILYINPYWRRAWFYFIEVSINNCYYFLMDNLPILSKF